MMDIKPSLLSVTCFLLLFWTARALSGGEEDGLPAPANEVIDFERVIGPLFKRKCQVCHGTEKQMGGLRLDTREAALTGGYSGVVIKPGDSAGSRLIHLVA